MKINNHFSIISIVIALAIILLKLHFDISTYKMMNEMFTKNSDNISASVISGGIRILIFYLILALIAIILSIIGRIKKNRFSQLGLIISIFTIIYLLIPFGILLNSI